MNEALNNLTERINSETPTHFVRVSNVGVWMAGIGFTVKIAAAIFPLTMPVGLVSLAPELIAVGLAIAGVAQTAKRDGTNTGEPLRKTLFTKFLDLISKK
jgi:hypothetical protein